MGLPLLGENLQFFTSYNSFGIPPFIEKRMQRYGPLFKTSLLGQRVVISTDPEFNHYILQQEGKLVELWYMDSFMELIGQQVSSNTVHRHVKSIVMNDFGVESLKGTTILDVEQMVRQTLLSWSRMETIEVRMATQNMAFELGAKKLISYDSTKSAARKSVIKMLRDMLKERRASSISKKSSDDFLDHVIQEMEKEGTFFTEEASVQLIFALIFATFETTSMALILAIKFLTDNPAVLNELTEEHEAILRRRRNMDSAITWEKYRSMTFTLMVIHEVLRLANIVTGIFRRALKDIQINGYTIPAGWTIMVCPFTLHLNPSKYGDPLAFNPWRWKGLAQNTSKNFIAFGGGKRSCVGAEYSKVVMAVFLHSLVTKHRWRIVEGGEIVRTPSLSFPNGFHIRVLEK
uniref:Cytochrome P450 87A3-like n=1 Tax=Nelumbo nucifera TaxID=4432 RepID=A0A822XXZ6_NELNU|nr:TPA_asm: hypothetical protein HUJ06_026651 [Nelumbo nucifera]